MKACPFIEASFEILGRKWNGQIIHYLSLCKNGTAHFSDLKLSLDAITPRALSLKLTELAEYGLVQKKVEGIENVMITYKLTDKGRALAQALQPIQKWATNYINLERKNNNE
jgi:DNA-binding HxlR family transcriptional regulator